ncbi:MAG: hypothetical protein LLG02_04845 [Pelosinus sp.]|nr:hypothetical protein [Pelosinus sp.]
MYITEKEIAQILDMIDCHTKLRSEGLENHSVCNQWSMTILLDNSFSEAEAAASQGACQVVDFMAKKAEMRTHFSVADQKIRDCIQQKQSKSLWDRIEDTFSRVLKKFIKDRANTTN